MGGKSYLWSDSLLSHPRLMRLFLELMPDLTLVPGKLGPGVAEGERLLLGVLRPGRSRLKSQGTHGLLRERARAWKTVGRSISPESGIRPRQPWLQCSSLKTEKLATVRLGLALGDRSQHRHRIWMPCILHPASESLSVDLCKTNLPLLSLDLWKARLLALRSRAGLEQYSGDHMLSRPEAFLQAVCLRLYVPGRRKMVTTV